MAGQRTAVNLTLPLGALGRGETLVRPVGVAISPVDGALYVSSDNGRVVGQPQTSVPEGAIYRVALDPRATRR